MLSHLINFLQRNYTLDYKNNGHGVVVLVGVQY